MLRKCKVCGKRMLFAPLKAYVCNRCTKFGRGFCEACKKVLHIDMFCNGSDVCSTCESIANCEDWYAILKHFNFACAYCGSKKDIVKDCIDGKNVLPSCGKCSRKRGRLDFATWYMSQKFYRQQRLEYILRHLERKR